MIGMPGMKFTMTVSLMTVQDVDPVSNVCPGKKGEKALVMENMEANAEIRMHLTLDVRSR